MQLKAEVKSSTSHRPQGSPRSSLRTSGHLRCGKRDVACPANRVTSGRRSSYKEACALVAQLDRASDFDSEGREFESLRARQLNQILSGVRHLSLLRSGNCGEPHFRMSRRTSLSIFLFGADLSEGFGADFRGFQSTRTKLQTYEPGFQAALLRPRLLSESGAMVVDCLRGMAVDRTDPARHPQSSVEELS
jgi:hypothetical protein